MHASKIIKLIPVAILCFVAGCTADTSGSDEQRTDPGADENTGASESAVSNAWTPYTSDEGPPFACDNNNLITGIQCTGSYCDNFRAYCQTAGGNQTTRYWTSMFSEEGTSWRFCNAGYWVTGMAATGSNSDNITLECSLAPSASAHNCYWTGWVSEENGGTLWFGYGYYATGAQCSGSNCDNMSFYVCQP